MWKKACTGRNQRKEEQKLAWILAELCLEYWKKKIRERGVCPGIVWKSQCLKCKAALGMKLCLGLCLLDTVPWLSTLSPAELDSLDLHTLNPSGHRHLLDPYIFPQVLKGLQQKKNIFMFEERLFYFKYEMNMSPRVLDFIDFNPLCSVGWRGQDKREWWGISGTDGFSSWHALLMLHYRIKKRKQKLIKNTQQENW